MHFCVYLFTKDLPNDYKINQIMYPYYEYTAEDEETVDPDPRIDIRRDSYVVGGRYCGLLKLKCLPEEDAYKWRFYIDQPRAGRLFRCQFLEGLLDIEKENGRLMRLNGFYSFNDIEDRFFNYSGIWDGYVCVDGCKISDLLDSEELIDHGYGFVDDVFGNQSTRSFRNREECSFVDNPEYENELKAAFERNKENYLTILDLHC